MGEPSPASLPELPAFEPKRILYVGEGILAFDKPAGIPVHRGTGHQVGLAEAIDGWMALHPEAFGVRPDRPVAPLHRLDLEASGVVLFGIARAAAGAIQTAFAEGKVRKRYLTYVAGPVEESGSIEGRVRARVGGAYRWQPARLDYRLIHGDDRMSLVEVLPREGRTHQIRSLFADAGRPLCGDLRYGKPKPARQFLEKFGVPRLLLHARELTLPLGIVGPAMTFRAPVPGEFLKVAAGKGWSLPVERLD